MNRIAGLEKDQASRVAAVYSVGESADGRARLNRVFDVGSDELYQPQKA